MAELTGILEPDELLVVVDVDDVAECLKSIVLSPKNLRGKTYEIGKNIVYAGYPSHHQLMSFNGRIVGYGKDSMDTHLIVNTYGWFGCSGSVMYDEKGKIIGILYGVDVEYYPGIQINENMIWVAPIKHINIEEAIKPFCRGTMKKYRACQ